MMKRLSVPLGLFALLAACAAPQLPVHKIPVPFDAAMAERLLQVGQNTTKGNAFMRQRGGGVVTCAGETVSLIPMTEYARYRMQAIYGSTNGGASRSAAPVFVPNDDRYNALMRDTKCDSQGNFVFERVADGAFFVTTTVKWRTPTSFEGGDLMQRVVVGGGSVESLVLSP